MLVASSSRLKQRIPAMTTTYVMKISDEDVFLKRSHVFF